MRFCNPGKFCNQSGIRFLEKKDIFKIGNFLPKYSENLAIRIRRPKTNNTNLQWNFKLGNFCFVPGWTCVYCKPFKKCVKTHTNINKKYQWTQKNNNYYK